MQALGGSRSPLSNASRPALVLVVPNHSRKVEPRGSTAKWSFRPTAEVVALEMRSLKPSLRRRPSGTDSTIGQRPPREDEDFSRAVSFISASVPDYQGNPIRLMGSLSRAALGLARRVDDSLCSIAQLCERLVEEFDLIVVVSRKHVINNSLHRCA